MMPELRRLLACLALLPAAAPAQTDDFSEVEIVTHPISEGIYYLQGAGGNIGVSAGEDGVFIIDDQFAPLTEKIQAAIAELSGEPVQFVVNTHFHYDHTDGNENFGAAGALIVAQENARERMTVDSVIQLMGEFQEAYDPQGLPRITFDEGLTFHYNGQTIRIHHLGPGHTDGDAIVHFVEADVMHTGDVFVRYGLPFVDVPNGGNVNGMIRVTRALLEMTGDDTQIIPGHGQLATREDLVDYLVMLETIRDRVYEGIEAGQGLEEIIAGNPTRDYPQSGIGARDFVTTVYQSFFK